MNHARRIRCLFLATWIVVSLAFAAPASIGAPLETPALVGPDRVSRPADRSLAAAQSAAPGWVRGVDAQALVQASDALTPTATATIEVAVAATSTATAASAATATPTVEPPATATATATTTAEPSPTPTPKPVPNLYVAGIRPDPNPPIINQSFTVFVTIGNRGTGDTDKACWIALYKDSMTVSYKEMPMYPIYAGTTREIPFTVLYASPDTPGYHFLYAKADSTDLIAESSESDNTGFVYLFVSPPPTSTPTPLPTLTPSITPTPTPTASATYIPTYTPYPTFTPSHTLAPTATRTPGVITATASPGLTLTLTATARVTSSSTPTTPTITPLPGRTSTPGGATASATAAASATPTPGTAPIGRAAKVESVVIGVFLGLLLVAGGLLALGPRLAPGGAGAAGMAQAAEAWLKHAVQTVRKQGAALSYRAGQWLRRIRHRDPDE